jgi:ribonuclease HII
MRCRAYALGIATVQEIDRYNIREATAMAMKRAVTQIDADIVEVLVDGDFFPELEYPARAIVNGDNMHGEIMAASILAKTARDDMLIALEKEHPQYGFARHKGYGTKAHRQAIQRHGACEAHRHSFAPINKQIQTQTA